MSAHQACYPVATMGRVLEVSTSGYYAWRKRVARLMRQAHLAGISRRRRKGATQHNAKAQPAPDLVQRNFHRRQVQPAVGG